MTGEERSISTGEYKARIECLSMFVRRLYRKLRKHEPDAEVITQANTYLKAIGQAGTPLRAEECAIDGEQMTPKIWWEYIGEELAVFWESPYGHGKEKIATFWWPSHPAEATADVEAAFEKVAAQLSTKTI